MPSAMESVRIWTVGKTRPINNVLDKLLALFLKPKQSAGEEGASLTASSPEEAKYQKLLVPDEMLLHVSQRIALRGVGHGVFWLLVYCLLTFPIIFVMGVITWILGFFSFLLFFLPALLVCGLNGLLTMRMTSVAVTNLRLLKMTPRGPISVWHTDIEKVEAAILSDKSGTLYYELAGLPYKADHLCDVREVEHLIKQHAQRV